MKKGVILTLALLFNLIYIKEGSVVLKGDHLREFIFSKNRASFLSMIKVKVVVNEGDNDV